MREDKTIFYDFHLWKGCRIKLGRQLQGRKKIERLGPRKVVKARYKNRDHFVLVGEIQGAFKELPDQK